jgi:pimeloyl-ACP methyl ester carboxylesterase
MQLSAALREWRDRGRTMQALGMNVFVIHENRSAPATPLVLLHGFPTSSFDFHTVLDELARGRPVITLDYPGAGLSDKPDGYSYSLVEQADVVEVVCAELGIQRAHLFAHDVGTSVATELLARRQAGLLGFGVSSVTLMNGSVHVEMAHLTPAQKLLRRPTLGPLFARLSRFYTFRLQMRRIFGRPDAVSDEELRDAWALLTRDDGHLRLPRMIGYVDERRRYRRRWLGALETLDLPCLILWGTRDPVAVIDIAEKLHRETPGARFVRLEGLGHYPQLEAPSRVAAEVTAFVASVDDAAK